MQFFNLIFVVIMLAPIIVFIVQIYCSLQKRFFWGLIIPLLFFIADVYCMVTPTPDEQHPVMHPINSATLSIAVVILLLVYVICRVIVKIRRTISKNRSKS